MHGFINKLVPDQSDPESKSDHHTDYKNYVRETFEGVITVERETEVDEAEEDEGLGAEFEGYFEFAFHGWFERM